MTYEMIGKLLTNHSTRRRYLISTPFIFGYLRLLILFSWPSFFLPPFLCLRYFRAIVISLCFLLSFYLGIAIRYLSASFLFSLCHLFILRSGVVPHNLQLIFVVSHSLYNLISLECFQHPPTSFVINIKKKKIEPSLV